MRRFFCMMFLQAVLASGKTVTKTFARITNVVISGPAEHTLVITNYYPSYTQHYTATWDVEYYDADVEVPDDDDDDEENEQENGGGSGGDVVFSTSVEWSISGAGAAFAEASAPIIASVPRSAPSRRRAALRGGGSSASSEKDVLFTEGNIEDVHLTLQLHVICTEGNGVGDDHTAEYIIHAPVWEPYTPISAYVGDGGVGGGGIVAPRIVAAGASFTMQIYPWTLVEHDKRTGAEVTIHEDALVATWSLPTGFTAGETTITEHGYEISVTAPGSSRSDAPVSVTIDDTATIPENEQGTRDDEPVTLGTVPITVVCVDSLTPDIGVEVDDGDDNPDTKTFVVPAASSGVVTVTAVPSPSLPEASLPASWSLTGGEGTGKLQRTIDRTTPETTIVSCTCGTSQKTTKIIVYKIEVTNIKFNHDTSSMQGDAINLRQDYETYFNTANGEWTRNGLNYPVCYVANRSVSIKARFVVLPKDVTSVDICADMQGNEASLGSLNTTTVSFANGLSTPEYVAFSMVGTTPNCLKKTVGDTWQWKVSNVNGSGSGFENMIQTYHTVYTILGESLMLWSNSPDNPKNAWTKALDFIILNASCNGEATQEGVLRKMTNYLFDGHGVEYDTTAGASSYIVWDRQTNDYYFNLTGYIDKTSLTVNCHDQAYALVWLGTLIGINIGYRRMSPFGYINPTKLVGLRVINNGLCNNPFFTSGGDASACPLVGFNEIEPFRTKFSSHGFNIHRGKVFDACAGPHLGTETIQEYLDATIDKSTIAEANAAGNIQNINGQSILEVH